MRFDVMVCVGCYVARVLLWGGRGGHYLKAACALASDDIDRSLVGVQIPTICF